MAASAMYHSPAEILRAILVSVNQGADPDSTNPDWSAYFSRLPDQQAPTRAWAVFNTEPMPDGRYMETGDFIDHYGVSILVRGKTDAETSKKVRDILSYLSGIFNVQIQLRQGSDNSSLSTYNLVSFNKTSGPVPVFDPAKDRAFVYSLSGTLSLEELV